MHNLSYDTFNKINLFFATNSNFSWKKFLEKWREVIFSFHKLPSLELRNARRSVITSYPSDINDWTEQASRKANGPRFLRQLLARGRFIRRRRKYGCIGRYIKCTRTDVDKERTHLQTIGVNAPFSFTNCGGSAGGASEARAKRKCINTRPRRIIVHMHLESTTIERCASISVRSNVVVGEHAGEINGPRIPPPPLALPSEEFLLFGTQSRREFARREVKNPEDEWIAWDYGYSSIRLSSSSRIVLQ